MSSPISNAPQMNEGPFSYENWKAAEHLPLQGTFEYPLFTDGDLIGELSEGYGPYKLLLNTVPSLYPQIPVPAFILRVDYHLESRLGADIRTDTSRYHGGTFVEEIASLISLCLGARLKAGGLTREFLPGGDPKGHPRAFDANYDPILLRRREPYILPEALDTHNVEGASALTSFPHLESLDAIALVRSSRLYQDALWVVESQPELSWLLLVSALETAAGRWRSKDDPPEEKLRVSKPDLASMLEAKGGTELVVEVANQIADSLGATKKFIDFVLQFLPNAPSLRPHEFVQQPWDTKSMKKSLNLIYRYRSKALHTGIPFPRPMCMAPERWEMNAYGERPPGLATHSLGASWAAKDIPMYLHTFDYIARNVLMNWWLSLPKNEPNIPAMVSGTQWASQDTSANSEVL
jgi:hypothetical protein